VRATQALGRNIIPVAHIQLAVDPSKGGLVGVLIVPFHKDVGHAAAQHARLDQPPQDGVLAPFHIHPAQRRSGGALLRHARLKGFLSERVAAMRT
jgi:hypothetical protein